MEIDKTFDTLLSSKYDGKNKKDLWLILKSRDFVNGTQLKLAFILSLREAYCDAGLYLVVTKVRERFSDSKREKRYVYME
jgi:hypothetical protein